MAKRGEAAVSRPSVATCLYTSVLILFVVVVVIVVKVSTYFKTHAQYNFIV